MAGLLLNSPSDVVRWLLVQIAVASSPLTLDPATGLPLLPWPAYDSLEPDQPDNCLTTFDTTGVMEGETHVDREAQSHYGLQVRVRAVSKPVGFAKANAIAIAVDEVAGLSVVCPSQVGTSTYVVAGIRRTTDPILIGVEKPQSTRVIYTINAIVALRQSS